MAPPDDNDHGGGQDAASHNQRMVDDHHKLELGQQVILSKLDSLGGSRFDLYLKIAAVLAAGAAAFFGFKGGV